jgi:hypothetical protein
VGGFKVTLWLGLHCTSVTSLTLFSP